MSVVQDRIGRDSAELDEDLIETGFRLGYGWLMREQLRWEESGALNPERYTIPAIGDLPNAFDIIAVDFEDGSDQYLIGSPFVQSSVPLALAVREAVKDALSSAGLAEQVADVPFPAAADGILGVLRGA
ncbi:MAG: hypothetical protein AAF585_17770 [Verrucomicrobiota bacterium]